MITPMKCTWLLPLFMTSVLMGGEDPGFLAQFQKDAGRMDLNKNGVVSVLEADKAISSPEFKAASAAVAVALRRGLRQTQREHQAVNAEPESKVFTPFFDAALKRIQTANRTLFVSPVADPTSIRQGKTGDCFCLAALRTMLQRDASAAARMIKPRADGAFSVRIGDRDIITPAPTDGEIALGASTSNGLWIVVYEKAVGLSRMKKDDTSATPFNIVTKGGSAGSMMSTLTTNPITRWSCKAWRDSSKDAYQQKTMLQELRQQMRAAFQEKRLVTGGTGPAPANGARVPGVLYNHGYAVIAYDGSQDGVTLWNPHGNAFKPKGTAGITHGYPTEKGEFTVPLTEAVQWFGGFAFEQAPAVKNDQLLETTAHSPQTSDGQTVGK